MMKSGGDKTTGVLGGLLPWRGPGREALAAGGDLDL